MRFMSWLSPGIVMTTATILPMLGCGTSYHGTPSDHFDGQHFFNAEPEKRYTLTERWKWTRSTQLTEWPEWIEDPKYAPPVAETAIGQLNVTHINHATLLIQVDGVNLLTDPIWSERASLVSWAGPKRVRAPGLGLSELPRIDAVLISHNHYDHLDLSTLKRLTANQHPKIIAGLGVKALLEEEGLPSVTELDWWQEYASLPNGLKIVFVPARHTSGRGLFDHNRSLWGGYVIVSSSGNIYFAGDTAYGQFLTDIKKRFQTFRLTLLPVGHYEPRWMMETIHMSPDDAVSAHKFLNSRQSIGMHFGTFYGTGAHNNEQVDQHEADLASALARHQVPVSQFYLLGFGESREVP